MLRKLITLMSAGMILLAVLTSAAYANVNEEWVARYGGSGDDEGLAIAKDVYGNIYVGGYTHNGTTYQNDWFIRKYDIMGTCLWETILQNPGNDVPHAIVVRSATTYPGVYVTGERWYASEGRHKFYTVKLDLDTGVVLFSAPFAESGENGNFKACAIAAYGSSIYVTGTGETDGAALALDIYTVQYTLDLEYVTDAPEDFTPAVAADDYPKAIVADNSGVYVIGSGYRTTTGSHDLVVIKYDFSLNHAWADPYWHDGEKVLEGGSGDVGWDIVAPSGAYVYFVGECDEGTLNDDYEYAIGSIEKSDGDQHWLSHYGTIDHDDQGQAIAYYGGLVYVTGLYGAPGGPDYGTAAYDTSDGSQVWDDTYDCAGAVDIAHDIAADYTGVFVIGESDGNGTGRDYATIGYQHNLTRMWVTRYDGPASGSGLDRAFAIVTSHYNAYVTGGSTGNGTALDATTIRYNYGPWIDLTLTSNDTIPPQGDSLRFTVEIDNRYWESISGVDVRVEVIRPNGSSKTLFARWNLTLPPEDPIVRDLVYWVPAGALPGIYTVRGTIGNLNVLPNAIYDQDYFTFVKLGYPSSIDAMDPWEIACQDPFGAQMKETASPQDYCLSQNYPNPFNASTVLSFQLPVACYVQFDMFDISGRRVAQLVNGWRNAGVHEAVWDASHLASGLYLYRLQAGDFSAVKKLMLVK